MNSELSFAFAYWLFTLVLLLILIRFERKREKVPLITWGFVIFLFAMGSYQLGYTKADQKLTKTFMDLKPCYVDGKMCIPVKEPR